MQQCQFFTCFHETVMILGAQRGW